MKRIRKRSFFTSNQEIKRETDTGMQKGFFWKSKGEEKKNVKQTKDEQEKSETGDFTERRIRRKHCKETVLLPLASAEKN